MILKRRIQMMMILCSNGGANFEKRNPPCFWRVPKSYMDLEQAKTIAKQNVFVACLHHARQPVQFSCESGLVVESGGVLYTTLWVHFSCQNRKTVKSLLQGRPCTAVAFAFARSAFCSLGKQFFVLRYYVVSTRKTARSLLQGRRCTVVAFVCARSALYAIGESYILF